MKSYPHRTPLESKNHGYVLYPNQSALFKTFIERDIGWWIERDEKDDVGATDSGAVPGRVFVESIFVRDGEKHVELNPCAFIDFWDSFERPYPESIELLHAKLTGDEQRIHNIMMMQEIMRHRKD